MSLDVNHGSDWVGRGDYPPGRVKIVQALVGLLVRKDFNAITTAEIAKTAGVTEALIYKYFKDKRDLLYQGPFRPRNDRYVPGMQLHVSLLDSFLCSYLSNQGQQRIQLIIIWLVKGVMFNQ